MISDLYYVGSIQDQIAIKLRKEHIRNLGMK
jgi:hypothetical protein